MYKAIAEAIQKADSIVIAGHIRPDGDCYGSQIGLKDVINTTFPEKKVYIIGSGLPSFFDFLGEMDVVDDEIIEKSLAIIVDLNEYVRIEDKRIEKLAKNLIQIDHHMVMQGFDFPTLVDEDACSTCELIVRLVNDQGWKMSSIGANAFFLGMLTDSAHFQFVKDFPAVFQICSFLCKNGAEPGRINEILSMKSEKILKVRGYTLTHYKKIKGIIYLRLTIEQLRKLEVGSSYGSAIVNFLGDVKGFPIWATFLDNDDGACIIEFRSNRYNVCSVAMKWGGGGHMQAAGVTIKNFNDKILEDVLKDLSDLIKE